MPEFTLRSKFTVFLLVVLSAFFLITVAAVYSLEKSTDALNEAIEEALEEEYPVMYLENLVQRAEMEAHDYLMYGTREEREVYLEVGGKVSEAFRGLVSAPFALDDELGFARKALDEWNKANDYILNYEAGNPGPEAQEKMEIFDHHIEIVLRNLQGLVDLASREIDDSLANAYGIRMKLLFMVAVVFVLGLAIMIAVGVLIARSILGPVGLLKTGLDRIGEGGFSHRVHVSAKDELGALGRAFNNMAEKLEHKWEGEEFSGPEDAK